MECPRCVAERRALRAGIAVKPAVVTALSAFGAFWLVIVADAQGPWPVDGSVVYPPALLSLTAACASLASSALARRFARRADTPQPEPAADPLATYREGGPVECPRHPFAR